MTQANEKYIGDALLQKTYTVDFITKKRVRNNGYVKRYYIENNHEAIISRKQYYMVQEELARRNNKMSSGTRYSSRHSFSSLILCEECGSRYMRVSWYLQTTKKRVYVWRCSERMQNGTRRCKCSPSLKEDELYSVILQQMQMIVDAEIENSSSMLLQTKALIVYNISGVNVCGCTMTKAMWDSIIENILIKGKEKAVIQYKTGMIQDITLC